MRNIHNEKRVDNLQNLPGFAKQTSENKLNSLDK